jgi:RNA polymerase sigma factor (sigma-70 family)
MDTNYEDIVRDYYNRYRKEFLRRLTAKYSALSLFEAENLYQDTFLAIRENLLQGRIKENTSWSSYIMTIGLNLASKEMRKLGKTDSIDDGYGEENEDSPSKTARTVEDMLKTLPEEETPLYQNQEAQSLLGDELIHTPEPCGSIIRLFYYEDKSMDEIAEEVGYKNATTAKSKKNQCMKDLIKRVRNALFSAGIIDKC